MWNEVVGKGVTLRVRIAHFLCTPLLMLLYVIGILARVGVSLEVREQGTPSGSERADMARGMLVNQLVFATAVYSDMADNPINEDGTRTITPTAARAIEHCAAGAYAILAFEGVAAITPETGPMPRGYTPTSPSQQES